MKRHTQAEFFGLAATTLGYLLTQPALAAPQIVTKSIVVKFADLDLSKPEDALRLYRRIQSAAHNVCRWESDDTRILTSLQSYSVCYRKAVDAAVDHANRPTLTALHQQESRSKKPGVGEERVAQGK